MSNRFNAFRTKITNNRKINEMKYKIKNRRHFRFTKTKDGEKYRLSKRLKYQTKYVKNIFIKKLCERPLGIIDLLTKIGIYKKALSLKLIFVLIPFIILNITDSFVVSVVMTIINIFCCYLMFSLTITEKHEAMTNGVFDYGKYSKIKAKKETIAIIIMFFISFLLVIIGHYYLESLIQIFTGLVVDI